MVKKFEFLDGFFIKIENFNQFNVVERIDFKSNVLIIWYKVIL